VLCLRENWFAGLSVQVQYCVKKKTGCQDGVYFCFVEERTGFQEQYKFIYDTLEEYCRGIDSRFPVSELANQIKEKTLKDKKLKKNAYALEYAVKKKKKIDG